MGGLRGLEDDRRLTLPVSAGEGGAVQDDPSPAVGTHSGLSWAAAAAQHVARDGENTRGGPLDGAAQVGQPSGSGGGRRFDGEPLVEDDQAWRLR